jgi:hypothetical protein
VVIDREISLGQTERLLATLADEQSLDGYLEELRRDIDYQPSWVAGRPWSWTEQVAVPLTHGTYDPDDDSTKTPERGYP